MKNRITLSALALAVSIGNAAAGDDWSGFHASFDTGVASSVISEIAEAAGGTEDFFFVEDLDPGLEFLPVRNAAAVMTRKTMRTRKLSVGLSAGFDQQFGNAIFGAIADASLLSGGGAGSKMEWVATARVKAGWAASEKLQVFLTAGLGLAGIDAAGASRHTKAGQVFGGGAEYRFTANWSLKGEYLHHDFGTVSVAGGSTTLKPRLDTFKLGLAYRF